MANTNKKYEPEFKRKIARLYLEGRRTIESINKEYHLGANLGAQIPGRMRKQPISK